MRWLLESMLRCDELGLYEPLENLLKLHGKLHGTTTGKDDVIVERLRVRHTEAEAIESIHGRGSLANLDHPTIKLLIARAQVLSSVEVSAARLFRDADPEHYRRWRAAVVTMSMVSENGPATTSALSSSR